MSRKKKKKGAKNKKMRKTLQGLILKHFKTHSDSTFSHKQICTLLDLRESALRKLAYTVLQDLVQENTLQAVSHGVYKFQENGDVLEGRIELTASGTGYVIIDGIDQDVRVPSNLVHQALHGDLVRIKRISRGRKSRQEGEVVEVVEREITQFVGTLELHDKFAFLVPDNQRLGTDIYIPKEKLNGAKDGEKVLCKITVWPKSADSPYGEVVERLGSASPNDTEMISILANQGLDYTFPQEVVAEAEQVGMELDEKEIATRRDMRDVLTFTIDPVDAKDFDDALSYRPLENGHIEVGIHIADVSHYVKPGTAMNKEALKRSNSIYLVDRVIPMLPEQLSNMACSLRPNEDKYSFSAVFEIDHRGKVYKEWYGKTAIHSDRRFTYEEAQKVITGKSEELQEEIHYLNNVAQTLRKKRMTNGALSIESEEIRFTVDENGYPAGITIKTSKEAHKLVEEFMLLANRKIAEFIGLPKKGKDKIPFVYRVHDKPDPERVELFKVFIDKFGYKINTENIDNIAKNINGLLSDIRLKNEFSLIQSMAIRSMSKATYETENIGHYGLAFKHYTHFTSPIRRYADLVVHRIVQDELTQKKHRYGSELDDICKRISRMERKAVEAERESTKFFQTLYVHDKVGEEFDGTISGLADFGMFVKMDENHCEGMVPIREIPGDRFRFDADNFRIIGSKTKKEFNFGDKVRVRIFEVHPRKRQIDLELVK